MSMCMTMLMVALIEHGLKDLAPAAPSDISRKKEGSKK